MNRPLSLAIDIARFWLGLSVCERDSKRPVSFMERSSATVPLGCPNQKGELSLYALAKSAVAASPLCYSPSRGEGRNGRRLALAR